MCCRGSTKGVYIYIDSHIKNAVQLFLSGGVKRFGTHMATMSFEHQKDDVGTTIWDFGEICGSFPK